MQPGCTIEPLTLRARQFCELQSLRPSDFFQFPLRLGRQMLVNGHEVISLAPRLARNSSKDFRFSKRQYCPARTSHRYLPSSTNRVSRSASFRCSHARISSILVSTNRARWRFSLGSMGAFLVRKLVKPTKLFCSWPAHQSGFGQILSSQAEPDVGAAAARILRKSNTAVRQELSGLDLADGVFDQLAEFMALLVGDPGA